MKTTVLAGLLVLVSHFVAFAAPVQDLPITAITPEIESDWSAVYYGDNDDDGGPLLLGNDGTAATGGIRAWNLADSTPLREVVKKTPGRTKLITVVYDVGGRDLAVTIAQPDSIIRLYDMDGFDEIKSAEYKALGDWSAICSWKSQKSGEQYVYLFGKKQAIQFLVRGKDGEITISEIQTFKTPVEASSCAVSLSAGVVYFSGDDSKDVYSFPALETTAAPVIAVLGHAQDDVTGLAAYIGGKKGDLILVAQKNVIGVYSTDVRLLGTLNLTGEEDIEIQGLDVFQSKTDHFKAGVITYALKSEVGKGFGVSEIDTPFSRLNLSLNTKYNPGEEKCKDCQSTITSRCNFSGFTTGDSCSCFAGYSGPTCETVTCRSDCSRQGKCVGANQCKCNAGWGGLYCSFLEVAPKSETDANGGDGDDPAIWISPKSKSASRIITTTKSGAGAGLGVFDLNGKLLQQIAAAKPNNVDIIYGFQAGERKIDLAYAACRADNTLCFFEITPDGVLTTIPGGTQPTKQGYQVYGSCVYRSQASGKQYLFVNQKDSNYLQYELTWSNGSLATTLVRDFLAGSGGQVEGCVSDEDNGWIFIGEEPYGLWRYDAEPDSAAPGGHLVFSIDDANVYADVEGVTLVQGSTKDRGFIISSCQGVSAYNVYRRAAPHEFVMTFTITESEDGRVDAVSNTDGIAAVGANLGPLFPKGLIVTHDDANQLPGGDRTSEEASFKLISLDDVLGAEQVRQLELLRDVDPDWDPRA
ncbi:thermostable phytase [Pleomassaria siparia CBS 279.74]|uniref:Thermostable phytase n=1 Tax=Pleomassaria siparia CBS 279.74 TaxID=1314801 RepID=A0A6G1K4S2_9PLEO|nr:thermostable phytase [Pleomassaria siparia CBS 279.74]